MLVFTNPLSVLYPSDTDIFRVLMKQHKDEVLGDLRVNIKKKISIDRVIDYLNQPATKEFMNAKVLGFSALNE